MFRLLTKNVTLRLVLSMSVVFLVCLSAFAVSAATITTITVKEKGGVSTANYPLTFGHVFKKGDATGYVYLNNGSDIATQTDVKTTYDDGSIRFAVISAFVPMTANSDTVLNINTTGTAASSTPMSKTEILATDIGATIDLTNISGSGYSGSLQADLRAAINSASSLNYWLEGGVCTEILIEQKLNNSLNIAWEVRFYPGTSYMRISYAGENVEAYYRGSVGFDIEIKQGNASPATVYTKAGVTQLPMSRWRKKFWVGSEPPEVEVHYDTDYLISTGHIMNYDTSLSIAESTIADQWTTWTSRDTDIYGEAYSGGSYLSGLAFMNFPNVGGRPDIGMLPRWAVFYLLTWDNRMRDITLGQAELIANAPMHLKESDSSKSFYGHIISIDDRPKVRTWKESTLIDSTYDPMPAAIGDTSPANWVVDRNHQAAFNVVPYMVTGEYFYLQELYYWGGWNVSQSHFDSSWGRDYSKGLIRTEVRGDAWASRNLADAAALAADGDIEQTYLRTKLTNNITQFETDSTAYTLRYRSNSEGAPHGVDGSVTKVTSGWMEDFFLLSCAHMRDLGFNTQGIIDEYSKFIINRFSNADFNWYNGAAYRFPTVTTSEVTTWAQASSLYTDQPTEFPDSTEADNYRFIAMAALSQVTSQPGGQGAYDWLKSKVPHQATAYPLRPEWALIPRGPKAPVNLQLQ